MTSKYYLKNIKEVIVNLEKSIELENSEREADIQNLHKNLNLGVLSSNYASLNLPSIEGAIDDKYYSEQKFYNLSLKIFNEEENNYKYIKYSLNKVNKTIIDQIKALISTNIEHIKSVHDKNLELSNKNKNIVESICKTIYSCGFKTVKSVYNSRKRKNEYIKVDWNSILNEWSFLYEHELLNLKELEKTLHSRIDQLIEKQNTLTQESELKLRKQALEHPLLQEAVQWLTEKGKILGKDYELVTALNVANLLAFDQEVSRMKATGGPFDIDNSTCREDCTGWDGENDLCECGARSVHWTEGYAHNFKNPQVIAETKYEQYN